MVEWFSYTWKSIVRKNKGRCTYSRKVTCRSLRTYQKEEVVLEGHHHHCYIAEPKEITDSDIYTLLMHAAQVVLREKFAMHARVRERQRPATHLCTHTHTHTHMRETLYSLYKTRFASFTDIKLGGKACSLFRFWKQRLISMLSFFRRRYFFYVHEYFTSLYIYAYCNSIFFLISLSLSRFIIITRLSNGYSRIYKP